MKKLIPFLFIIGTSLNLRAQQDTVSFTEIINLLLENPKTKTIHYKNDGEIAIYIKDGYSRITIRNLFVEFVAAISEEFDMITCRSTKADYIEATWKDFGSSDSIIQDGYLNIPINFDFTNCTLTHTRVFYKNADGTVRSHTTNAMFLKMKFHGQLGFSGCDFDRLNFHNNYFLNGIRFFQKQKESTFIPLRLSFSNNHFFYENWIKSNYESALDITFNDNIFTDGRLTIEAPNSGLEKIVFENNTILKEKPFTYINERKDSVFYKRRNYNGGDDYEEDVFLGTKKTDLSFSDTIAFELIVRDVHANNISISNNHWKNDTKIHIRLNNIDTKQLNLLNNSRNVKLSLANTHVSNNLYWDGKNSGVFINKFSFDERALIATWEPFENNILRIADSTEVKFADDYYHQYLTVSVSNSVVSNSKINHLESLNFYKRLSDGFNASGNNLAHNEAYQKVKELETLQLKENYRIESGFNNWFRWQLNSLISTYTDYGTNPAKAVIISFWVVLCFSFFYMFFPSDWDITSKAAILANFKRVRDKNDKTASPIFLAMGFLLVSFANAFTLSLNSFVTLGFGHIPTHGIARYFTILQGFVGWFLLTIFSVSLISQVLN